GSAEALLEMAKAGCAMQEGPKARAAFRKLKGRAARSEAIVACREAGVDVLAKAEDYTGPELLAQARRALAAGDAKTALEKAHASNKVERSSAASLVKALAACALGDAAEAKRLQPHVSKKDRPELHAQCKARGIALPE
ncbi:MAG: hypothetical protein KDK70_27410, partial [Myxococcales bacterium]|nr:hypothetical protein [Myxococcales bacterium]